jgi:hypothetical protein
MKRGGLFTLAEAEELSAPTPLRVNKTIYDALVSGHASEQQTVSCDHGVPRATIQLRCIGYIDQQGNVWTSSRAWMSAGGPHGSVTPLYINPGCD